jgi:hypothetical protein
MLPPRFTCELEEDVPRKECFRSARGRATIRLLSQYYNSNYITLKRDYADLPPVECFARNRPGVVYKLRNRGEPWRRHKSGIRSRSWNNLHNPHSLETHAFQSQARKLKASTLEDYSMRCNLLIVDDEPANVRAPAEIVSRRVRGLDSVFGGRRTRAA